MYASGHFLIEQRLLAVEVLLRQRRARIGCDPLGRYLCSVTALDDGDRLSGADRITEPLEKPGDGTAGPRGHDSLAARCRSDGRLRDDFGAEAARCDRFDADVGRLDRLARKSVR